MALNWPKVEEIFHRAAALDGDEQAGFLDSSCDGIEERREVEALLAADQSGRSLPEPYVQAPVAVGDYIDKFQVLGVLGRGASGTVYAAHDALTGRKVAIKLFPPFLSSDQRHRYIKEAQAASSLRHPYIVAIEGAGKSGDSEFLVMECVDGVPLSAAIPARGMTVERAIDLACMLAEALAAAHSGGVIHRDLKPSNIMLTAEGKIKVLDFGLAKLIGPAKAGAESTITAGGQIVGTVCYLSPEQARGEKVDPGTDIFSFGVVLYEMLTGATPFDRGSLAGTLSAILRDAPPPVRKLRRDAPGKVARVLRRCLEKDRDRRFASANDLLTALAECRAYLASPGRQLRRTLRRPRVLALMVSGMALFLAIGGGLLYRAGRVWQARTVIEPEIRAQVEQHHYNAADELMSRIETMVPGDRTVRDFIRDYRIVATVLTTPEDAEVSIRDYGLPYAPWRILGRAPLKNVAIPLGYHRWRVRAAGFLDREFAETGILQPVIRFALHRQSETPAEMEAIPAGFTRRPWLAKVPEFWLDRFEVTNGKYQEFVNAGGYRRSEFWQEPFVAHGKTLPRDQAMALFRDQTGRPGPAGWQLGHFPEGLAEFPVRTKPLARRTLRVGACGR